MNRSLCWKFAFDKNDTWDPSLEHPFTRAYF